MTNKTYSTDKRSRIAPFEDIDERTNLGKMLDPTKVEDTAVIDRDYVDFCNAVVDEILAKQNPNPDTRESFSLGRAPYKDRMITIVIRKPVAAD